MTWTMTMTMTVVVVVVVMVVAEAQLTVADPEMEMAGQSLATTPGKTPCSLPCPLSCVLCPDKDCICSPALSDSSTGGTGLWYTGCYINEEDACLADQIKGITPFLSQSQTFPDQKALTIKNVTVGIFCQGPLECFLYKVSNVKEC